MSNIHYYKHILLINSTVSSYVFLFDVAILFPYYESIIL